MANFIPRFEWNDQTVVGDIVLDSVTITNVPDTSLLITGMFLNDPNFPNDSFIVSTTLDSITMSAPALADDVSLEFIFFERHDFDYPSIKQAEPKYLPTEQISESIGGKRQTQINNVIKKIEVEFKFVTVTKKQNLETRWYLTWAMYAKEFRYFESKDELDFEEYALDVLDFAPTRDIPKLGNFLYKLAFKMRRIYL